LSEHLREDPRAALTALAADIKEHFGERLLGLYVFGSLVTGDFYPGRSDLDLITVLDRDVAEGADLAALRDLHERFERDRPEWRDRIEVLYIGRDVLATFAAAPTGTVARISPGEPLHLRELEGNVGWLLDWHGVLTGETLFAPAPPSIGPDVSDARFRDAVRSQLREMAETARQPSVAYVPAHQGYIVATVCRALYSLATGQQTSKERAVAWLAQRRPDLADFLWSSYRAYRADVRASHERLIAFVDDASASADDLAVP
jgi:predicted nucleotidyltransferase